MDAVCSALWVEKGFPRAWALRWGAVKGVVRVCAEVCRGRGGVDVDVDVEVEGCVVVDAAAAEGSLSTVERYCEGGFQGLGGIVAERIVGLRCGLARWMA